MKIIKHTAIFIFLCSALAAQDFDELNSKVLALSELTEAPEFQEAEGFPAKKTIQPIFYKTLPYKGKETRSFAWLGIPELEKGKKAPAIVLVHGGGGSAFIEWVEKWNARGYIAISIAVEGQTTERAFPKTQHQWAGPLRNGIYGDSAEKLEDQWIYHAVADTILAHSLLSSLPEVDQDKIGLMGISWGGVITSTVIGIDSRFAFAIPVYGCGSLSTAENQYGKSLGENELYKQVWDPIIRLKSATLPVLWFSWPADKHFPLDCQAASYHTASGPHMVSLILGLNHGHSPGWSGEDSYEFADSIVSGTGAWCLQNSSDIDGASVKIGFTSSKKLDSATLVSTTDTGVTGDREWNESAATLDDENGLSLAKAKLPKNTTAWFINVKSGKLTASSDFFEVTPSE